MSSIPIGQHNGVRAGMPPKGAEVREAEATTEARRAMRPELRRAAEASWKHDQDGLRYLARR